MCSIIKTTCKNIYNTILWGKKAEQKNNLCYTFSSSTHGTFSRTDHILRHKSSLNASKKTEIGNSLVVQWLGLCASTAGDTGQSLVRELRSHMLCSTAKKKKRKKVFLSYKICSLPKMELS